MKFSDQLRSWTSDAVAELGMSKFSRNSGIDRFQLAAFLGGYRGLSIENLDRLMSILFPKGFLPAGGTENDDLSEAINTSENEAPQATSANQFTDSDLDDLQPFIY